MPSPSRLNGVSDICGTVGAPEDERFSALGRGVTPVPAPSPQPQSENITSVRSRAPPVGGLYGSHVSSPGDSVIQGNLDNGCLPLRVGSNHVGQNSEWHLGPEAGSDSRLHVLVKTDNTTVVAYINRQGSTRSLQLHRVARKILVWSSTRLLSLRATHVPGVLNRGADLLSRGNPLYGEWTLHPQVVKQVWQTYGQADVDLFASQENAHCPRLISTTLTRVREQGSSLILIAPRWPSKHWVAEIIQLLADEPWPLPIRRDLLSQAGGEIYHPHPDRIALWAWPVRGGT
ncbi:hypothetical protein VZT92_008331 [Zoarces viviparus]|uniref:Uncharacterized protein n=1 Tax=Zoarces viviparus TaxID=48416 RepID=A0AAW1FE84_ZOAVI